MLGRSKAGEDAAKYIADALIQNKTLTTLNAWRSDIGAEGAKHITDGIQQNKVVTTLNIGLLFALIKTRK